MTYINAKRTLKDGSDKFNKQMDFEKIRARDNAEQLLFVVQMAYRKHACDDDSIGWEELQDRMCDVLCNVMGDIEFQRVFKNDSHN